MSAINSSSQPLDTLYSDHHGWLHGWLRRKMGNAFDAADVTHDTFLRILVSGVIPPVEKSRAHLTQIAKGLAIDLYRRRQLEAAYLDALALLPEDLALSAEERLEILQTLLQIDAMLDTLPAHVRQAFLLSQLDGLTYHEIAVRLSVSVSAVRKYMLQAAQACHRAFTSCP
jgi:RNA polymerase sigma factor (sigma-70 family)